MSALRRPAALTASAALCLAAVSGCATSHDTPAAASPAASPTVTTPTVAATTPSGPSSPAGTASPAGNPPIPATLTDRLLAAADVPGLTPTWHWQDGETGAAPAGPFGTCAHVDLLSIGASTVVQRTYFPPVDTDDHADEQIAEFPDAATAARAAKVLDSWRSQCATRVTDATGVQVGAATPVSTAAGVGSWYLVSSRPTDAEENRYEAVGTVVDGTRIAVLLIVSGGRSYSYPVGHEPMVGMVAAAARLLE